MFQNHSNFGLDSCSFAIADTPSLSGPQIYQKCACYIANAVCVERMPVYTSWDQPAFEQLEQACGGQTFASWTDPVDILPAIITRDIPINYWGRNLDLGFLPSQLFFCFIGNRQAVCTFLAHSSLLNLRCVSTFWTAHIAPDTSELTYEPNPEPATDIEPRSFFWLIR